MLKVKQLFLRTSWVSISMLLWDLSISNGLGIKVLSAWASLSIIHCALYHRKTLNECGGKWTKCAWMHQHTWSPKKTCNWEATLGFGGWLGWSISIIIYLYLRMFMWSKECWSWKEFTTWNVYFLTNPNSFLFYTWFDYFCTLFLSHLLTQYLFFSSVTYLLLNLQDIVNHVECMLTLRYWLGLGAVFYD